MSWASPAYTGGVCNVRDGDVEGMVETTFALEQSTRQEKEGGQREKRKRRINMLSKHLQVFKMFNERHRRNINCLAYDWAGAFDGLLRTTPGARWTNQMRRNKP